MTPVDASERLRPYVPGFAIEWLRDMPAVRHRQVEGTLAFVDVSGFTRLTERLAVRGKAGAEEMSELLDRTFAQLLAVAYSHGAWLVKWGGDAVLLLFQDEGHAERACTAAIEMRRTMDVVGRLETSCGRVRLRVSTGVHSGSIDMFLVGESHHELVIAGPASTTTAMTEAAAEAGEVGISPSTAALLPAAVVRRREDGLLLAGRSPGSLPLPRCPATAASEVDVGSCLPLPTRQYLLAGEDDAEHRLVGVAFVEFSGTDALLREQGPGATAAAIDAVITSCQRACTRHGVSFWETDISKDGGKVMLVAGVPTSSGNEEDAILAVARDIVEDGGVLPIRVGVNSGRVFFGQFGPSYRRTMSIKGDAVNLAARLMGKAAPGEVLAAVQVVATARTPFAAEALEPFLVKGKTQPIHACRVGPVLANGHVGAQDDGPFVGRTAELSKLQAHWRLARAGRLQVCELVGEPGVGKSRLVRELVARADGRTLEMRADQYTAASAYAPFRRLLREVLAVAEDATRQEVGLALAAAASPALRPFVPLAAAVVDAEVAPTAESDAVDERFRAQRQEEVVVDLLSTLLPEPTTFFLDDAHLLDASSVSLLRRLVQRAPDAPWLLLVCRREETEARPLEGIDGVATTVLAALDTSSSLELVHALTEASPLPPHEAAQLLRRAGGNPLFLAELAAATAAGARLEDLPHSVEHIVAARIDALDRGDRALLRAAAVIGMDVRPTTLRALAEQAGLVMPPGALDRLSAFLAPVGPDALRFRHAMVQEAAYEGLPYSRRKVLHGHVGDVLSALAGPEADAVLSLHFLRAERHDDAWVAARRAGDRAWALNAPAEAAELYERALHAARYSTAAHDPAAVCERLGDARHRLGSFASAADAFADARRAFSGSALDTARVCCKTANAAERMGHYRSALGWLTRAQHLCTAYSDETAERLLGEIAVARATVRHWQGRHADAARESSRAVEIGTRLNMRDIVADALVWLDVSELMLGRGDGSPALRALQIWRDLGDRPWHEGRCLNELGIRAYYAGRWDDAIRYYDQCRSAWARAGDAWASAVAQGNLAELLVEQGRLAEAEPLVHDALRVWRASGAPRSIAFGLGELGRIASRSGRTSEAVDLLSRARRLYADSGETLEVLATDVRLAEHALLAGDHADALEKTDALISIASASQEQGIHLPALLRVRALALAGLGHVPKATDALAAALSAARDRAAEHQVALVLHAKRALLAASGVELPAAEADELAALVTALGIVEMDEPVIGDVAAALPRQRSPLAAAEPRR